MLAELLVKLYFFYLQTGFHLYIFVIFSSSLASFVYLSNFVLSVPKLQHWRHRLNVHGSKFSVPCHSERNLFFLLCENTNEMTLELCYNTINNNLLFTSLEYCACWSCM